MPITETKKDACPFLSHVSSLISAKVLVDDHIYKIPSYQLLFFLSRISFEKIAKNAKDLHNRNVAFLDAFWTQLMTQLSNAEIAEMNDETCVLFTSHQ